MKAQLAKIRSPIDLLLSLPSLSLLHLFISSWNKRRSSSETFLPPSVREFAALLSSFWKNQEEGKKYKETPTGTVTAQLCTCKRITRAMICTLVVPVKMSAQHRTLVSTFPFLSLYLPQSVSSSSVALWLSSFHSVIFSFSRTLWLGEMALHLYRRSCVTFVVVSLLMMSPIDIHSKERNQATKRFMVENERRSERRKDQKHISDW